jgi:hypothetical protein
MPKSINRKLAEVLVPSTTALKESVLDDISAGVTPYATLDDLPTSNLTLGDQAFVTSNQRLYLSNGSGWYNVAMFNATPNLTISPSGAITLATDGSTPTVITLTGTDSDNADANLVYTAESDGSFGGLATLSQDSSVFTITPLAEGSATTTVSTLTFKVSDGINFGSGTTEFSLTFSLSWTLSNITPLYPAEIQSIDYFGSNSAIDPNGNYFIAGAHFEDGGAGDPTSSAGSAYIYYYNGSTWTEQAILRNPTPVANDYFGKNVDISGDWAVVGMPPSSGSSGGAYVYQRSGTSWSLQQTFEPTTQSRYGTTVAMASSGKHLFIAESGYNGNVGRTWFWNRVSSTWFGQYNFDIPGVSGFINGGDGAVGNGIAVSDNASHFVMGAYNEDSGAGAVHVWSSNQTDPNNVTWTYRQKLTASDGSSSDYFGRAVEMSGDGNYIAVFNQTKNAVYIFSRLGETWTQQAKIPHPDPGTNMGRGLGLNYDGTVLCAAAIPSGGYSSAYVYTRSGTTWTFSNTLGRSGSGSEYFDMQGLSSCSLNSTGTRILISSATSGIAAGSAGGAWVLNGTIS